MTGSDEVDDEMWFGMDRHEYRALNTEDQKRAFAAMRRITEQAIAEGREFTASGRALTAEECERSRRARERRRERMSRPPYTDGTSESPIDQNGIG